MKFDYYQLFSEIEALIGDISQVLLPLLAGFMAVFIAIGVIGWIARIAIYVVRSVALYIIADRRGVKNPWLAWIPVGRDWVIGSLSDRFKHITEGKQQSRRKILLALSIASVAISLCSGVPKLLAIVLEVTGNGLAAAELVMLLVSVSMVVTVTGLVVGTAKLVFHHMSMYDVYRSCCPRNAVLFLVLGILFGITEPFFLLWCRNKDDGMPKGEENSAPAQEPKSEEKPEPKPEVKAEANPEEDPQEKPVEKAEAKPEEKQAEPKSEPELPQVIHLPAGGDNA